MAYKGPQRRMFPRAPINLDLELHRRRGNSIHGRTLDVGQGGMRVSTDRPLSVDEVLEFALEVGDEHVDGLARVLREQGMNVYALRFEGLPDELELLLSEFIAEAA